MNSQPLVSVIIATKNESKHIGKLLQSLRKQTYKNIECIIVDNFSSDNTLALVKKFSVKTFTKGPERSTQRNFGAQQAKGKYLLFLDADMILGKHVIQNCVLQINSHKKYVGIIIPEKSIGKGFWAKCKALEKSFYVGVDWIEAARFYRKDVFQQIRGYDVDLISGEDFDLSQKAAKVGEISRVESFIYHDEGNLRLLKTISKKFYYAKFYGKYTKKWNKNTNLTNQTSLFLRYRLYLSQPKKLFAQPVIGVGMLYMKSCEFFFGALGYVFYSYIKK